MAIQSSSAQSHEQKLTSKRGCGEPRPTLSKNGRISWQAVQGSASQFSKNGFRYPRLCPIALAARRQDLNQQASRVRRLPATRIRIQAAGVCLVRVEPNLEFMLLSKTK